MIKMIVATAAVSVFLGCVAAVVTIAIAVFGTRVTFDGDLAFVWPTPQPLIDTATGVFSLRLADTVVGASIPPGSGLQLSGTSGGTKPEIVPTPPGVRPGDRVVCHVRATFNFNHDAAYGPQARITDCRAG
ncbi:hypothetical protein [Nocardia terpenica]|nr:hypothetical protein [Nocardia terpenica]NQE93388.1 hypothetical protein [Nocardia terpenica]